MYCKHCGKEIADDSVYCNFCGTNQKEVSIESKQESIKVDVNAKVDATLKPPVGIEDLKEATSKKNIRKLIGIFSPTVLLCIVVYILTIYSYDCIFYVYKAVHQPPIVSVEDNKTFYSTCQTVNGINSELFGGDHRYYSIKKMPKELIGEWYLDSEIKRTLIRQYWEGPEININDIRKEYLADKSMEIAEDYYLLANKILWGIVILYVLLSLYRWLYKE